MNEEPGSGGGEESPEGGYLKGEETVGELLLAARERSKLTLEQVSQETKVPMKMLEYLETDNFEAIPAKVYAKGFLRSYARHLGFDVGHILSKYEVQTGQTHKSKGDLWEIETEEVVEEELLSPRIFMRFVLPVVMVVIVVLVIWKISGRKEAQPPPQFLPPVVEQPIDRRDETGRERKTEAEKPEEPAETSGNAREIVDVGQPEPGPIQLRLIASPIDSVWFDLIAVSTVDQSPETTTYDFILFPGQSRSFEASEAFILRKVGNAGGFDIELNGRRLPRLGEKGRIASNVKLTRDDLPGE